MGSKQFLLFVSGDIQYVKRSKFDQIHVSQRFFCFPGGTRVCPSAGEFLSIATRCVALILVLAASEHLGELNLGGIGSGRH